MPIHFLGRLIVPGMALLFAGYMVWEQYSGGYRASTRHYATGLGALIAIFALLSLVSDLREYWKEAGAGQGDSAETPAAPAHVLRLAGFVFATAGFILALPAAGYLVGFFLYMAVVLLIVGYRPYWQLILIAALITAFVHGFFVVLFDLPLPRGYLFTGIVGQ